MLYSGMSVIVGYFLMNFSRRSMKVLSEKSYHFSVGYGILTEK